MAEHPDQGHEPPCRPFIQAQFAEHAGHDRTQLKFVDGRAGSTVRLRNRGNRPRRETADQREPRPVVGEAGAKLCLAEAREGQSRVYSAPEIGRGCLDVPDRAGDLGGCTKGAKNVTPCVVEKSGELSIRDIYRGSGRLRSLGRAIRSGRATSHRPTRGRKSVQPQVHGRDARTRGGGPRSTDFRHSSKRAVLGQPVHGPV